MVPRRPLLAATRKPGFLSSYPEDIKSSSAQPASTATGAPLSPELDTKTSAIIIQDQNNLIQQHCQQANYRTPDTVDDDTVTTTQIQDEILEVPGGYSSVVSNQGTKLRTSRNSSSSTMYNICQEGHISKEEVHDTKQKPTNASDVISSIKRHDDDVIPGAEFRIMQPALPLPIVPPLLALDDSNSSTSSREQNQIVPPRTFKAIARFASATLSREGTSAALPAKGGIAQKKKKRRVAVPRSSRGRRSGTAGVHHHKRFGTAGQPARAHAGMACRPTPLPPLPPRPINPRSLEIVRHSYEVAAKQGYLKRPIIHVDFSSPKNCRECFCCSASDFLYVYVGLCNVFLLQFVMVVLWFFSQSEVNLSDLGT